MMKLIRDNNIDKLRVLLIEDEISTVRGTIRGLERKNFTIDKVGSVVEAENCIGNNTYDLLIIDIRIPLEPRGKAEDDAGLDIIRRLRNGNLGPLNRNSHFIILTAQNRAVRIDEFENNKNFLGVFGKLEHMDFLREIEDFEKKIKTQIC